VPQYYQKLGGTPKIALSVLKKEIREKICPNFEEPQNKPTTLKEIDL